MARRITTEYVNPPIPIREFDWCAYFPDSQEPGEPQGYGRTREDAIADLLEKVQECATKNPYWTDIVNITTADHIGRLDEIENLSQERDSLRATLDGWLIANGPGGWIDTLRAEMVELTELRALVLRKKETG